MKTRIYAAPAVKGLINRNTNQCSHKTVPGEYELKVQDYDTLDKNTFIT